METNAIIKELHRIKIDNHRCLGCGYEHSCGTRGCAIMRNAADTLKAQQKRIEELENSKRVEIDQFNQQIGSHVMTRGDQIRAMSDEELADRLHQLYRIISDDGYYDLGRLFCDGKAECIDEDGEIHCNDERRKACIVRYLQKPAEVSEDGK